MLRWIIRCLTFGLLLHLLLLLQGQGVIRVVFQALRLVVVHVHAGAVLR